MKRATVLLLLALTGCPAPAPPNVVTIKGTPMPIVHFLQDPERRYATVSHPMILEEKGVLCSWNRDRHLHFFSLQSEGDFDIAFLDIAGKVLELRELGRTNEVGITSAVEARRALILHEGWTGRNALKVGDLVDLGGLAGLEVSPMPVVKVGGNAVNVEISFKSAEKQRGLMHRPRMSADDGMLFLYPGEGSRSFWMKNTLIPLDIAYFNAKGELVSVHSKLPAKDPATGGEAISAPSGEPAQFVLEVNYKWFEKKKLVDGEGKILKPVTIEIPDDIKAMATQAD